jgi:cobalamin synthase
MNIKDWLKYFGMAWDMLIDLPLPKKVVDFSDDESYDINAQRCFPLVGLLVGLLTIILAALLSKMMNMSAAAILFAAIMTIFIVLKDSARSLGSLVSFIELKTENVATVTALYNMKGNINIRQPQSLVAVLSIFLVMIFYLLMFGLMIIYNCYFWMLLVFMLSFTIQGTLATVPSVGDKKPLIAVPPQGVLQIWYIAGFISLFVMFYAMPGSIFATLITFALAFLGTQWLGRFSENKVGGISINMIGFAGFIFEVIALLIGIIFLV